MKRLASALLLASTVLCAAGPLPAQDKAGPLAWEDAVREAVERAPSVQAAVRRHRAAGLEEPLILSNLDPRFEMDYSAADDQSPRVSPAFEGSRLRQVRWRAGVSQNTLLGTQARLVFQNDRLMNSTPFRPLDPSVDSTLGLELSQPLLRYFWGRPDTARRRRARAEVRVASSALRAAREEAAMGALRAFWELLTAQKVVRIREDGVADARRLLAKYEEKKRYGLAEESDLMQAGASLESQETELLLAASRVERARHALLAALGRTAGEPLGPLKEPGKVFEAADPDSVGDDAADGSVELEQARGERETLEWAQRIGTLDTLPELSLRFGYSYAGLDTGHGAAWSDLGSLRHSVRSAGVGLAVPFSFWKERLTRRQVALRLEEARAREDGARAKSLRELRDAREALRLARRHLEARRRLEAIERGKFEAEERNFKRGRSSTDLLLRFQQDIRRAQLELSGAEMEEVLSRAGLSRASGKLLESLGL